MTKKLKPFNLEAAKNGDPICFADGRRIFFIGVTRDGEIAYEDERYPGVVCTNFTHNLRMLPKKKTYWINLYEGGNAEWFEYEMDAKHMVCEESDGDAIIHTALRVEVEE